MGGELDDETLIIRHRVEGLVVPAGIIGIRYPPFNRLWLSSGAGRREREFARLPRGPHAIRIREFDGGGLRSCSARQWLGR